MKRRKQRFQEKPWVRPRGEKVKKFAASPQGGEDGGKKARRLREGKGSRFMKDWRHVL